MNERIREIALRFFEGTITAEEECELYGFLNGNPQGLAQMREWESCWKRDHVPPADVLDSLDSLRRKIRRRRPLRRLWLRISVLALVSTLVLHLLPAERPEQLFTVEAPQGTHSRISLPDGTQVWLNAGSALSYGSSFNETSREVSLSGEAYFEVAKNPERPFIVDMGNASIRVLGTTFSVKADKGKDQITAVLLEGSIRFESPTQQVLLAPDQQLTFIRSTNKIDIQSVNAKENLAWKDGLLKYKSIALCTLLNELEKRYEIPIHIENKRLLDPNVTVSGTFSEDQSLKEILQVISRSLPIKWSQRDGTYYIQ